MRLFDVTLADNARYAIQGEKFEYAVDCLELNGSFVWLEIFWIDIS
jgi:hypothetical protein